MKKVFCVAGIAVGGLCVALGIVILISNVETVEITSNTYGADFYTDSQNAMAAAANNISDLCDLVRKSFGFILIGIGLSDICFFGIKFAGMKDREKGVKHSHEEDPKVCEAVDRAPLRASLTDEQKRKIIRVLKAAKIKVEAGEMTAEEFKALKNRLPRV